MPTEVEVEVAQGPDCGAPLPGATRTAEGIAPCRLPDSAPAALFMTGTPLHSFWSLGLMRGPFSAYRNVLAVVDQKETDRDYLAEVLAEGDEGADISVLRFAALGKRQQSQPGIEALSRFVRQLQPAYIAVGNDRRVEFHVAIHAAPQARRAYVEDGLFSYVPRKDHRPGRLNALRARAVEWGRSRLYGLPLEKPTLVGGSRAVQEAWVMLPDMVHEGLSSKRIHALRPEWFVAPGVRESCRKAACRADFDPGLCPDIRLLLLLPHGSFLQQHPEIARRVEQLAESYAARGQLVAFKCHPRSSGVPIRVPQTHCFEVPRRLPIEILAPLMTDVTVVGTLTTALISLKLLGQRLDVRSLAPDHGSCNAENLSFSDQTLKLYDAVGIRPFT
jgi:hypothetical protein